MPKTRMVTTDRPIRAVYYTDYNARNAVKLTRGKNVENMVFLASKHLRYAHFGDTRNTAVLCEVFDEDAGVVHAIVKRKINGDIEMLYQRPLQEKK